MSDYEQNFELRKFESKLIGEIYKCALDPTNWRNVLAGIQHRLGALEVTIMFYDAGMRSRNFAAAANADEIMVARFVSEFIDIEADIARKTLANFHEGEVVDVIGLRTGSNETYEKNLGEASQFDTRPNWEVQLAVPLLTGISVYSSLGVYQPPGGENPTQAAIDFMKELAPHLSQAIRIHNHISSLHQENTSLYTSIQQSTLGIFLLDQHGAVTFSNTEALRIIKAGGSLKISRFGKLQSSNTHDQERLDCVLTKLLRSDKINPDFNDGVTLPIYKPGNLHPLKLTLIPFSSQTISDKDVKVAAFVNDPERPLTLPHDYIQQVYKLTRVECEIAQALLDTLSIDEIAGNRGTTLGTARWQVKKIMEKTECHTQGELCKLMQSLCDTFSIHSLNNHQQ